MSDRIDHADEATRRSNEVYAAMRIGEESPEALASLCVMDAVLALVEQQRIANLIALSESGRSTVNGARAARGALYLAGAEGGSASMAILPDIAAALGIEVE